MLGSYIIISGALYVEHFKFVTSQRYILMIYGSARGKERRINDDLLKRK